MSCDVAYVLKEFEKQVTVEDEGKFVVVHTKGYIKQWRDVNELLKENFNAEWVSLGKQSHWRIPLANIMEPERSKEGPIALKPDAHERRDRNLKNIHEAAEKLIEKPQGASQTVVLEAPKEARWKYLVDEGVKASDAKDNAQWLLGELALTIAKEYGKSKLSKYAKEIGVDYTTLTRYRQTARAFEKLQRCNFLSWMHHYVASKTDARFEWLQKARENNWSTRELIAAIILEHARRKKEFGWELPEDVFVNNIWKWEDARPDYGSSKFRGNCDGRILLQIIKRYCPNAKFVIDPMAGSGTVYDVCKHLKIKCFAFDILADKWHEEVKFGDATKPWSIPWSEKADVVFIHFPYWNMIEYAKEYEGPLEKDVSILPLEEFLEKSEKILENAKAHIHSNSYLVILIGLLRRQGRLYDLPTEFSKLGQKHFQLYDKIVKVGWAGRETSARYDYGDKPLPFCRINYETVLIFKPYKEQNKE